MEEVTRKEIREAVQEAVQEAFSASVSDGRYIDVSRIPLICQSIVQIGKDIAEMKENLTSKEEFWPVKTLVYGITGLMLAAVVGALLMLIIKM